MKILYTSVLDARPKGDREEIEILTQEDKDKIIKESGRFYDRIEVFLKEDLKEEMDKLLDEIMNDPFVNPNEYDACKKLVCKIREGLNDEDKI